MKFSEIGFFERFTCSDYPNVIFIKIKPVEIGRYTYNVQSTKNGDYELYSAEDNEEVEKYGEK